MFEIASKVQRRQTTTKCFLALNFFHIAYILHFQVAPLDQYFFLLCFVCKPKRAYENIARIAKAAQHKLPGKSSLNVGFVYDPEHKWNSSWLLVVFELVQSF